MKNKNKKKEKIKLKQENCIGWFRPHSNQNWTRAVNHHLLFIICDDDYGDDDDDDDDGDGDDDQCWAMLDHIGQEDDSLVQCCRRPAAEQGITSSCHCQTTNSLLLIRTDIQLYPR